jgi:hypothetical protein
LSVGVERERRGEEGRGGREGRFYDMKSFG